MLNLTPGNIVTAPRSDMMYVVTEFGMVNFEGKSVPERAEAMFLLAHPDFRGYLARDARANGLLGVGFAHDFAQGRLKIGSHKRLRSGQAGTDSLRRQGDVRCE